LNGKLVQVTEKQKEGNTKTEKKRRLFIMKKIMATISALLICVSVLTGCGKADPVQDDLLNYINNQMPAIVELENKVNTEFEASNAKGVDDATFAAKLKDVILPASNELVTKTKAILPATEEVRKVHNQFLALVTDQHETFTLLLQMSEAVKKSDAALADTLNEKIKTISNKPNNYSTDLEALKKAHGVENEKKDK